ncbi:hypothetical protein RB195_020991 [Necator americanus]|uniref:Sugar phosphate transporter domain-containing protein n=1 Tax=Necator americanus TaxID=51031 RepID=A0ABR1CLL5_NECAM
MRGRPVFALVISVLMVVTGSLNTISAKWADRIEANGIPFNHPFLQAACMFIGELLCMVAFWVHFGFRKYMWKRRNKAGEQYEEPRLPRFNPFVFLPPAIADIIATSLMYIGLNLTTASSYQMLRGALIVCTGLLSIFLVNAHIQGYKCEHKKEDVIIGDVLCVLAQAVVALQLVLEQKYLRKYDVEPLLAVGLEGIYGLTLLIIALVPLYFIHVTPTFSTNPEGRLEDVFFAWDQIRAEPLIAVALVGLIISIAFFNFAGTTVTKELSATTRTVIDSIRTIVVWGASIPLFHAKFIPLQIIGFVLLILGMFIYNDIIIGPWFRRTFLPSVDEPSPGACTRCCFAFCGVEREEDQTEEAKAEKQKARVRAETLGLDTDVETTKHY